MVCIKNDSEANKLTRKEKNNNCHREDWWKAEQEEQDREMNEPKHTWQRQTWKGNDSTVKYTWQRPGNLEGK